MIAEGSKSALSKVDPLRHAKETREVEDSSWRSAGGGINYLLANRLHHTGIFFPLNKYCMCIPPVHRESCSRVHRSGTAPGAGSRTTDQRHFVLFAERFGWLDYSQILHTQQEDNQQNPKKRRDKNA